MYFAIQPGHKQSTFAERCFAAYRAENRGIFILPFGATGMPFGAGEKEPRRLASGRFSGRHNNLWFALCRAGGTKLRPPRGDPEAALPLKREFPVKHQAAETDIHTTSEVSSGIRGVFAISLYIHRHGVVGQPKAKVFPDFVLQTYVHVQQ